ncbi:hypothetical protein GCM10027565_48120 [Bordetella tumulicola]
MVTSFITEAGLRGSVALMAIMRGPPSSWTIKDKDSSGNPEARQARLNSSGITP